MSPDGLLKQSRLKYVCLLGVFLVFTMGCRSNVNSDESQAEALEKSEAKEPEHTEIVITTPSTPETFAEDLKKAFSSEIPPQQAAAKVKKHVVAMLPYASGKNKDKLNEIVRYLDGIEKKPDEYFEDMNNGVELMQVMIQLNITGIEMDPDNFDVNFPLADSYFTAGSFVESFLDPSEENKQLSSEYKQKALKASKELVKKFPNEAKAYRPRAFYAHVIEGDAEKALELYERCLELDPEMEPCQRGYDVMQEDLKK